MSGGHNTYSHQSHQQASASARLLRKATIPTSVAVLRASGQVRHPYCTEDFYFVQVLCHHFSTQNTSAGFASCIYHRGTTNKRAGFEDPKGPSSPIICVTAATYKQATYFPPSSSSSYQFTYSVFALPAFHKPPAQRRGLLRLLPPPSSPATRAK